MNELSLTGETTETHVIAVPADARAVLEEQGVPVPESITLLLREATLGERRRWQAGQANTAKSEDDQRERIVLLVLKRVAPDTDERVVRAVLDEANNSALMQLMLACITGYMPDPKDATEATGKSLKQATERVFAMPSATSPSPATSTD